MTRDMARIWRVAPWLIAVLLVAATSLAAVSGFARDERKLATARADVARSASSALEGSLRETVERTESVAGLYKASHEVTPDEFARVASPLLRSGGPSAVLWIEHLTDAHRSTFERRLGLPIVRLGADDRLERERRRPAYDVIVRLAQRQPTRSTLGLDVGDNPSRGPTLRSAEASRAPRSTPIVKLAGSLRPGTIVYVPVFDRGSGALRGFASGTHRVDRLRADVRAAIPAGTGVRISQGDQTALRSGNVAGAVRSSVLGRARARRRREPHEPGHPRASAELLGHRL